MKNLQVTRLQVDGASIYSSYLPAKHPRKDNLTVVVLHGAGQSSSERFTSLAQLFADEELDVVMLDFIGHGKTGGAVHDNSLGLRTKHALAVIKHWRSVDTPLILCGSSMSGHTALRVSAQLGPQVKSLYLLQPAIYAAEAENVFFGPKFTRILHEHESWRSSLALRDAATFKGKALVAIGSEDKVIPWEVIEALAHALKQSASGVQVKVIEGVGHELPTWLPDHTVLSKELLEYLTLGI